MRSDRLVVQQVMQERLLVGFGDADGLLRDGRGRVASLAHLDGLGLVQDAPREGLDGRRHGRREQHRLALLWHGRHNPAHVLDETHVEHPVGLVEHQDVDPRQVESALAQKVQEPARRGDYNVDPVAERRPLCALAHAAVDGRRPKPGVLPVGRDGLGDLDRQLARRADDEGADRPALAAERLLDEVVQDGEDERGGLARAGLGHAHDVHTVEGEGQGSGLDGRGRRVAGVADAPEDGGGEPEGVERVGHGPRGQGRVETHRCGSPAATAGPQGRRPRAGVPSRALRGRSIGVDGPPTPGR